MTSRDLPSMKCLVVDDLDENLLALEALLGSDELEVVLARSGNEALAALAAHDFALVLLDVFMPGMDGFAVAERLRAGERNAQVPIIFITASTTDRVRVFKGYDVGAVDFLHKPVEPHVLCSKVGIFIELHRQRLALDAQLQERNESLRLNQMFMSVLSHDLRSPLSAMLMGAAVLKSSPSPERIERVSQLIIECGERMQRMVADLMDVTRARLGTGMAVAPCRTDVAGIVTRLIEAYRAVAPQRTIVLHASGDSSGDWDADRLAQVFDNLLGNAVTHGASDAPVRVDVDGTAPDRISVVVTNAGAIPAVVLEHLFDPFHGAARPRGRNDGLGLGLYIAQQIVLAHGGDIAARSSPGSGTAITVTLPRHLARRATS